MDATENKKLPLKNCWKNEEIARAIHLWFRKYVIALSIGYTVEDKNGGEDEAGCAFCTGFLLCYHNEFMWLTAGHVLEIVDGIFKSNFHNIHSVAWNDNDGVKGISKIPVDYNRLRRYKVVNNECDIGVILFKKGDLDFENIRNNLNNKWFVWENSSLLEPDGFCLIGFPVEVAKTKVLVQGSKAHCNYDTQIMCFPVEKIKPDKSRRADDFWKHAGWFYGKALPIRKDDGKQLEDIKGMSGGPIISFNVSPDGVIKFWPVAIQSTWLPNSRILCGTPISKAVELTDAGFEAVEKVD